MIEKKCSQCGVLFLKNPSQCRSKKDLDFCGSDCSATYNNLHRKQGTGKRSKFELFLEGYLHSLFPKLEIKYNCNTVIKDAGEFDVYIPSLCMVVELQGPYHFFPISGEVRLQNTKINDQKKRDACLKEGIELMEVDISEIKSFKRNPLFVQRLDEIVVKIRNEIKKRNLPC